MKINPFYGDFVIKPIFECSCLIKLETNKLNFDTRFAVKNGKFSKKIVKSNF